MPDATVHLPSGPTTVKFGRNPPTPEMIRRTVPLGPYLKRYGAKPPPAKIDYGAKAAAALKDILGNDSYGDCVIAAELHGVGVWTANEPGGTAVIPTAKEAVAQYRTICGPGDNGCYIPAVLNWFRDKGMTAGGKLSKIDGYVSVNPRDQLLVQYALWLFGGLNLGVNWPSDWTGIRQGFVLKPTNSRMVGGHSVMVIGYDDTGLQISTWGITGTMSWDALADNRFVDECYARLGSDWYNDAGVTAAGVNVSSLREALKVVAAGGYPDIPDDPNPPVPPNPPPPPAPGDIVWEFLREFDLFGFTLHLHAALTRKNKKGEPYHATWLQALMVCWDIIRAVRSGDWATALASARELVSILAELFSKGEKTPLGAFFTGMKAALADHREGEPPAEDHLTPEPPAG